MNEKPKDIPTIPKSFDFAIIDLDPLVYRCGYAVESGVNELGIQVVEPVKHAFYNINSMMNQCLELSGTKEYYGYLTGKNNFRNDIYKYYKENRVTCAVNCENPHPFDCHRELGHELLSKKPVWYKEIREHIQNRWKGEVINGMEADDMCSIMQYRLNDLGFDRDNRNSIVWSFDKDFNNIPGWHGNYITKEIYYIEPVEALRNFYLQIVTGDPVDGIPRVFKGWRKKKVEKLLQDATNEESMFLIVLEEVATVFLKNNGNEEFCNSVKDILEFISRNGKLVHLLRTMGEQWEFPIPRYILMKRWAV